MIIAITLVVCMAIPPTLPTTASAKAIVPTKTIELIQKSRPKVEVIPEVQVAEKVVEKKQVAKVVAVKPKPGAKAAVKPISRSLPVAEGKHRTMTISVYTANDSGMDGNRITASGANVQEGVTVAADKSIPFGTKIYIPKLGKTYTVQDRGGAIGPNRLDIFMESRSAAMNFGIQTLEVIIQ